MTDPRTPESRQPLSPDPTQPKPPDPAQQPLSPDPAQPQPPPATPESPTTAWQPPSGWTAEPPEPGERRGSLLRWLVVAAAAIVVVALLGTAVWLAAQTPAGAPAYLADDTFYYTEVRLDLPGGQQERAADVLAHFPGFADRASLEAKIDDTLDRLFRDATEQRYSYTSDVKPWFNGQVAVGFEAPATAGPTDGSAEASPTAVASPGAAGPKGELESFLVVVGIKDRAAAQAAIDRVLEDARSEGALISSADYRGATIWTFTRDGDPAPTDPGPVPSPFGELPIPLPGGPPTPSELSLALTDDALLLGAHQDALHEALDRRAGAAPRLSDVRAFREGMAGLRTDRIGAFWMSGEQLRSVAEQAGAQAGSPSPSGLGELFAQIPDHIYGTLHLDSDRLVAEVRTEPAEGAESPTPRESDLASRVPAETLAYVEVPAVGDGIGRILEQVKAQPGLDEQGAAMLEQVEGLLGVPLEDYLDWAGDAALAGWLEGDEPRAGVVVTVIDSETAQARVDQLVAFLRLGALSSDGPIQLDDEDHQGTTITTLTVDTEAAGLEGGVSEVSLSWAVDDDVFVLSPDAAFVRGILDGAPEGSLADSERFREALATVGGPATAGITYVDVARIREAVSETLSAPNRDAFERDVEPYLEPLDIFIAATVADGDELVSRAILTVADRPQQ